MRAALYARYSSDKQSPASITDQFRNCETVAEREGWEIALHFQDDALSGASSNRPGYRKMLDSAMDRQFDILIVDDLSRLSRDDVELKMVLRRFLHNGLRVVAASDGFDSANKGYKLQAGLRGIMNEAYLDDLKEKTHRGLKGKALAGQNTGGRSYGYKHIAIEDPSRRDEYGRPIIVGARREIDPEQAEGLRQIFAWYADGRSPKWIASELNRQGIPALRGGKWAASAIYGDMRKGTGLLNNEIYIGKVRWNRSEWLKDPDTGKRVRRMRPQEDWVEALDGTLAIVPQELWEAVKARQGEQRERSTHLRQVLHEKARTGAGPKYLFSSLLKCGCCGANYAIADRYRYGCSTNINRGEAACPNRVRVSRALLEAKLLQAIKRDLFCPEGIEHFRKEVQRLAAEAQRAKGQDSEQLSAELRKAEYEVGNLVRAVAEGKALGALLPALEEAEKHRDELRAQLTARTNIAGLEGLEERVAALVDGFEDLVANLETLSLRDVTKARNTLRQMLGGQPIRLVPDGNGGLIAELQGDYAQLVALNDESPRRGSARANQLSLVAGAGFEPATFRL